MLKQMFLVHFRLVVTGFDPRKIPKCLESKHTAISSIPPFLFCPFPLPWARLYFGHPVSAEFRKTRRYTKVVCCVLMIHSHTRVGPVIIGKYVENEASMLCAPDSARRGAIQKSFVAC